MNITFRWINLEKDEKIEELMRTQLLGLEKFAKDLFKKETLVQVELGKSTRHHRKGPYFYLECQLSFPKKILRAVAEKESFEEAIDEVKDELLRQIKKYKSSLRAKAERRMRKIKREKRVAKEAQKKEGKRVWYE